MRRRSFAKIRILLTRTARENCGIAVNPLSLQPVNGVIKYGAFPEAAVLVAAHVSKCLHHSSEIRQNVREVLGEASTGAKADEVRAKEGASIEELFKRRNDADFKILVNHAIVKLICGLGMAPYAVDTRWFKEFILTVTCSRYNPMSGTTLTEKYVAGEAARIQQLTMEHLKSDKVKWITFGFDAGATRNHRSFLTIHATDQERRAHFLQAENISGLNHTADLYSERVLAVR